MLTNISINSEQMNQSWNLLTKPSWLSCCLSKWCLCRLQLFCGMLARIEQFADVMRDSKLHIQKVNVPLALTVVLLDHGTATVCVYTSRASQESMHGLHYLPVCQARVLPPMLHYVLKCAQTTCDIVPVWYMNRWLAVNSRQHLICPFLLTKRAKQKNTITNMMQGLYHQAIFGDLNTMAHGIARFSPKYCKDKMRFWSIGQSEAEFWDHTVFKVMDPDTSPEQDSLVQQRSSPAKAMQAVDNQPATQTGKEARSTKHNADCSCSLAFTVDKLMLVLTFLLGSKRHATN